MSSPSADACEVVVTGPDADALAVLVRTLVDERLIACGQITGSVRAIYRWAGAVCDEPEVRAVLHTTTERVSDVAERIRGLHPYDVPCVAALPIIGGDHGYLHWISSETR